MGNPDTRTIKGELFFGDEKLGDVVAIDYAPVEERLMAHAAEPTVTCELPLSESTLAALKAAKAEGLIRNMESAMATAINGIPDHVSIDKASPHFWSLYYLLGVRIDGRERLGDVHEFCVSEGWAKVRCKGLDGKPYDDGTGHWATETITGRIEPYMKGPLPGQKTAADADRLSAAEAKRARKAAKRAAQCSPN